MPIYEYYCNSCGHKFEYLVFGSNHPANCLVCDANSIKRLISVCGFVSKNDIGNNDINTKTTGSSCGSCSSSNCSGCK